jgi:hypothetical protein
MLEWGYDYDFASSMSHLRSDLVGLLVYDSSLDYLRLHSVRLLAYDCMLTISRALVLYYRFLRTRQPTEKRINILGKSYGIKLLHNSLITTYIISILHP